MYSRPFEGSETMYFFTLFKYKFLDKPKNNRPEPAQFSKNYFFSKVF